MLEYRQLTEFWDQIQFIILFGCFFLSLECLGFSSLRLRRHSLDGMGPFWEKPTKSLGRQSHYVSFGRCGRKERNMLVFDNAEFLVQMMKNSFICNLWS